MFWLLAGLLSVIVTVWLLVPLLQAHLTDASRAEYDINVYRDQLAELDRDVALGRIAGAEADAARLEIQRRLLSAGDEAERPARPSARSTRLPVIITVLAVPVLALAFYYETGSPSVPDFPLAARTDIRTPARATDEQSTMRDLAGQLEERLRQNPDDAKGWVLLGRTYATIGNARKAAAAYARATVLTERRPEVLADWAEARLMALDGTFTPEIFADFLEARDRDPQLPKPWFYIGLDKAMGGDLEGAAQTWTDLLAITPKDAPFAEAVRAQIARA
ncbi:MAG: c-type cytochrome biogenesis protein CcmI, partial [Rhodospirillales bacterium]